MRTPPGFFLFSFSCLLPLSCLAVLSSVLSFLSAFVLFFLLYFVSHVLSDPILLFQLHSSVCFCLSVCLSGIQLSCIVFIFVFTNVIVVLIHFFQYFLFYYVLFLVLFCPSYNGFPAFREREFQCFTSMPFFQLCSCSLSVLIFSPPPPPPPLSLPPPLQGTITYYIDDIWKFALRGSNYVKVFFLLSQSMTSSIFFPPFICFFRSDVRVMLLLTSVSIFFFCISRYWFYFS